MIPYFYAMDEVKESLHTVHPAVHPAEVKKLAKLQAESKNVTQLQKFQTQPMDDELVTSKASCGTSTYEIRVIL